LVQNAASWSRKRPLRSAAAETGFGSSEPACEDACSLGLGRRVQLAAVYQSLDVASDVVRGGPSADQQPAF